MNDLCYEDGVCLNSFHCVFVHKEVSCTKKTEIKDGLQYANKKLSLLGYNNNELETAFSE